MWQGLKRSLARRLPAIGTDNAGNRDAWVAAALGALPAGSRLLDAGAGQQPYRKHCAHLCYVSQDFGEYDGRGDATGMQVGSFNYGRLDHRCDILEIPEPDGAFDAILCTEVIEHVPDPIAALREFSRLLRPGGRLILTAPFTSATHFAPYHFCTGFSRYFYTHHLPRLGFDVLSVEANGNAYAVIAQELRRLPLLGGTYGGERLSLRARLAIAALLPALARLSRRDDASHEFLCFGYHVQAQKTPVASDSAPRA